MSKEVRLIDANELKCNMMLVNLGTDDYPCMERILYESDIDEAPTIDAVPEFHARWDETMGFQDGFWVCSACNFCTEATAAPRLYKYCPNCGSMMDAEE